MSARIALLRAVNLGPHGKIAMADLKALAADLGFKGAKTLLNSGNLVFGADGPDAELEKQLERETEKRFGLSTDYMVRDLADWRAMIAANPYPQEARDDPGHLVVVCLKSEPGRADLEALVEAIPGRERVTLVGRDLFAVYPDGIGESKLTAALMLRKLKVPGTGRNWNTVNKLAEAAAAIGA